MSNLFLITYTVDGKAHWLDANGKFSRRRGDAHIYHAMDVSRILQQMPVLPNGARAEAIPA